ncbi:FtsX-like permease family protein [Amycolatopsis sp. NPDC049868]|uniref:FtsX-like permease family protein n=1 Tax=Amycolatopsis sp. NPDC049868 TaxID=3363934 RepID=UPI0037A0A340
MNVLRRWRLALRIAGRELRRSRGVTILVVALVALPLIGVCAYFTVTATSEFSPEERIARALGGADGRITSVPVPDVPLTEQVSAGEARLTTALGPGSDPEPLLETRAVVGAGNRDVSVALHAFAETATTSPLFGLVEGRAPEPEREIGLSVAVAGRLGVAPGETVRLSAGGRDAVVSGLYADRIDTASAFVIVPLTPSVLAAVDPVVSAGGDVSLVWLVRGEPGALAAAGETVLDRAGVLSRIEETPVLEVLGVFLAVLAEIAVVTCAAFAVVARRQRRTHGLLAVVGAEPRQRVSIAYATGVLCGCLAVAVGVPAGVLAAWALLPVFEDRADQDWGALTIPYGLLLIIALFAVLATTISSVLVGRPAAVARPLDALHGRDVVAARAGTARRFTALGLVVAGVALLGLGFTAGPGPAVLGGALIVLGCGFGLTVVLAALVRGHRGPLWFRLVLRDASMATARPSALATAIAGIVMFTTTAAFLLTGLARQSTGYVPSTVEGTAVFSADQPLDRETAAVAAAKLGMPGTGVFREVIYPAERGGLPGFVQADSTLRRCLDQSLRGGSQNVSVDECAKQTGFSLTAPVVAAAAPSALPALIGRPPDATESAAFDTGAALVLNPALRDDTGKVTLRPGAVDGVGGATSLPEPGRTEERRHTLPAVVVGNQQTQLAPMVLLSEASAERYGLKPRGDVSMLFRGSSIPTPGLEDEVRSLLLRGTAGAGELTVERGDPKPRTIMAVNQIAAGVAVALSLAIVITGVALAAGESRGDFAVLAAVGADPRLRRRIAAGQAGLVAISGAVIGIAAGYAAAASSLHAERSGWTLTPVLFSVGGSLLLVAVALIAARQLTSARLPVPRVME